MIDSEDMLERAKEKMVGKKKGKVKAMSASMIIASNPAAFNPAFHQAGEGSFNTTPYEQAVGGAVGGAGNIITGAGRWVGEEASGAGRWVGTEIGKAVQTGAGMMGIGPRPSDTRPNRAKTKHKKKDR